MNAIYYSIAFGSSGIAPVQLVRSLQSLRHFDRSMPVFVFLFGESPPGFLEAVRRLNAEVRPLGDYLKYIAQEQPDRAELIALDPKLHRWLVLKEPELKACNRLLYIDSDTFFFAPPTHLFDRYRNADLFAREEPLCRRSILGYQPSYLDEEMIAELRASEGLSEVPPFNTGVCLLNAEMRDSITSVLPRYFDNLFRFFSWFYLNPPPEGAAVHNSMHAVYDRRFRPEPDRALRYPSTNRWIVDQISMWLALGQLSNFRYLDFRPSDVWQGAEYQQMSAATRLPMLCHYFGSNTAPFFERLQTLTSSIPKN